MAKQKRPPQEQAFLDDILANAADDTPRLVFADWLTDHGQDHRGEFIRLQCRLAKMDEDDPEREALKERQWELLVVHRDEWRGLPKWVSEWRDEDFRRGFTERVSVTATEFLKKGHLVFGKVPVRDLNVRSATGQMAAVAASPYLRQLLGLDLSNTPLTDDDLAALTASPHLENLTALRLARALSRETRTEALAAWPRLRQFVHLDLSGNNLDADRLAALARVRPLTALRRLNLSSNYQLRLSDEVFSGGRFAALTHLEMTASPVNEGMAAITRPGALPGLVHLHCGGQLLSVTACERLGQSDLLERLQSLSLTSAQLTHDNLHAILRPGRVRNLRRLELTYNSTLGNTDSMALLAAAPLHSLRHLDLVSTNTSADDLRVLVASPHLSGLRSLHLNGNRLGDAAVQALVESPHLTNLTDLTLHQANITPAGAATLAAWPGLARIRRLNLRHNALGAEGFAALASSPYLGNLVRLELAYTDPGEAGLRALAAARDLGNLRRLDLFSSPWHPEEALRELAASPRLPRLLVLKLDYRPFDTPNELRKLGRDVTL